MADNEDKDLEKIGGDEPAAEENKGEEFAPFTPSDEDLPDDVPAVSMAKKKNLALFIGLGLVVVFIVYNMVGNKPPKVVVPTDIQQMQQRTSSAVPKGSAVSNENNPGNMSAGSALPGATKEGVPEIPMNIDKKQAQTTLQETLPPPPTLPPVFDPASIYVKGEEASSASSAPSFSSAPGSATFSDRYTRKRSRLPELESATLDDNLEGLDPEARSAMEAERQKRITSSMFVGGAKGGAPAKPATQSGLKLSSGKSASVVEDYEIGESGADKQIVTIRRELERVILQGKVMDAVLETAINTDLPGKLRAIVSRDVYSESGKRVVIPKGSRLIGAYATDIKFGQARVYVIWNRVIRPDGIDAIFDSTDDMIAVDSLGRSGVYGQLDNRFFEIFGSSILLSSMTVAFAVAADAAAGGDNTTTSTTPSGIGAGTSTTTGDVVSQGVAQAVSDLGSDVKSIAQQYFKTAPRITVDQGTRIKIFVNKDVIFPPSYFTVGGYKDRDTTTQTEFLN